MTARSDAYDSRALLADDTAAIQDPREQYDALVTLNGHVKNMVYRRMNRAQLDALREYANTQPALPFAFRNLIASEVTQEIQRNPR